MTNQVFNRDDLKMLSILYVEDDEDIREQMTQYLRRRVGTLLVAKNGVEGLNLYRTEQPDMIVTDILMPIMDGLEMADEIRKTDITIPIIVTTAFESTRYFMRSIEIGIDKYVTKPVDTDLFYRALQSCSHRIKLDKQLQLAYKVFEHCAEGILITDVNKEICWINPSFTEITGYTEECVLGKKPQLLSSGRQDKCFYLAMWAEITEKSCWKGEIWNKRKNGEVYPQWLSINVLLDKHGNITNYVGIFSDISERKAAEDQIRHLANHDPLTGLPNRNLLRDRMAVSLAHAGRKQHKIALLLFDLDNFKHVNDTFGHQTGDTLLLEVANRLKEAIRSCDTICRLGGDEFVIVLDEILDVTDAIRAAEVILEIISPNLAINGQVMGVSPSIGIVLYPHGGADLVTLLKNADAAMYAAKRAGGNRYHVCL
jgi:diguanylate cyclase (GGDEF)-like protein/PAS domain S-box-containing protein